MENHKQRQSPRALRMPEILNEPFAPGGSQIRHENLRFVHFLQPFNNLFVPNRFRKIRSRSLRQQRYYKPMYYLI